MLRIWWVARFIWKSFASAFARRAPRLPCLEEIIVLLRRIARPCRGRAAGEGGRAVRVVAFETDQSYVDLRHSQLRA